MKYLVYVHVNRIWPSIITSLKCLVITWVIGPFNEITVHTPTMKTSIQSCWYSGLHKLLHINGGWSPFHWGCMCHEHACSLLIVRVQWSHLWYPSGDNSINFVLQDGWSPLMIASENGHLDIVVTLIGAGADVNYTNKVVKFTVNICNIIFTH